MTKEDFIQEMRKLDKSTRREVVDRSNASHIVKTLAKQDPQPPPQNHSEHTAKVGAGLEDAVHAANEGTSSSEAHSGSSSRSGSPSGKVVAPGVASQDEPETAAERRRRLAALKGVGDDEEGEGAGETAAERRRREAALGTSSAVGDEDSDDDDTPRVPPPRRGIRFADVPRKSTGV